MMAQHALIQTDTLLSFLVKLPVPGTVVVHLGQSVEPGDEVAEAILPAKFQVFDVLNQFRIRDSELEGCIKRLAGEEVQRGDVIAKKPGLISRLFRAPEAGKVVAVRDGRVTLAMGEKTIQARTPIGGTIAEVITGMGAVVVTRGLSLRGSWGNGKIVIGNLVTYNTVTVSNQAEIKDAIVFMDSMAGSTNLKALQDKGAAGILVTTLDPSSKTFFERFDLPLMSLIGFGEATLDPLSRALIAELQNSQVILVARKADPYRDLKPELFQTRETAKTAELFPEPEPTIIGRTVRLLGQPYFGSVGKIVQLPQETERMASGIQSQIAVIKREDETVIRVPLDNFEILTS